MPTISVSACRRPEYLRMVLEALRSCDNIKAWEVLVHCDMHQMQEECVRVAAVAGFPVIAHSEALGCNRMIRECVQSGFRAGGDYHVHLEDDTMPAQGFLRFCEWAAEAFWDKQKVLSFTGYNRETGQNPTEYREIPYFCAWGWGTWRDRWEELDREWPENGKTAWDTEIHTRIRRDRTLIQPRVSRIQNIGMEYGTYLKDPDTYWTQHWSPDISQAIVYRFTDR
jgi:hypothetical protein